MATYYADKQPQADGAHLVHRESCRQLPAQQRRFYLGEFASCAEALREGRKFYPRLNGCPHCTPEPRAS